MLHVLEAEGDNAPDDLAHAKTAVPEAESGGLLGLGVPLTADEHEAGRDGCFEDAEEDAGDKQRVVVEGSGSAGCCNAPEEDVGGEPFGHGDLLEEVAWECQWVRRQ